MAERPKNPVGALESSLAEEAGHSDDYTAKLIARKKKNTRKRRYGESTEGRYWRDFLTIALNGSDLFFYPASMVSYFRWAGCQQVWQLMSRV